jgi:putative DNA primase/helicase
MIPKNGTTSKLRVGPLTDGARGDVATASRSGRRRRVDAAPAVVEAADDPNRLARLFLDGHRDREGQLLFRYWQDEAYLWRDGAYRKKATGDARAEVVSVVKAEFDRLAAVKARALARARAKAGKAKDRKVRPVAPRKVTAAVVGNVLENLRSLAILSADARAPAWLGGDGPDPADLLVCRNAIVDLPAFVAGRNGAVLAPTPRLFALSAADLDFDPAAPPPAAWLNFLGDLWGTDAESIETLGEFLGYLLTPDTSHQKILMLVGPPRSGKGTIGKVIGQLLGQANVAGPTLSSLGSNFGLWPLVGKLCAIISDARLGGRSDLAVITERLLSISGEDAQTIDRKNLPPITTKLPTRFIMLTNELPRLVDASGALASRFIILRLQESFLGREDIGLMAKLTAELPGILLWAIDGWRRLRERGYFRQPKAALAEVQELADLASPVSAFVRDCCRVGPGCMVERKALYAAWKNWCTE